MAKKLLGLIINPKAGLGGSVGLKGSDGEMIQRQALRLGAVPHAVERGTAALEILRPLKDDILIVTYPGEMGTDATHGFDVKVIGKIASGKTTSRDTNQAAKTLAEMGADLILFAGGDGTARDIHDAIGLSVPALGIPAGVKIHSSVYAIHPRAAGELTRIFLRGEKVNLQEAEVMDIDEDALRNGIVSARLYGYLKIPYAQPFVQNTKSATPASEITAAQEIAESVVSQMVDDVAYIIGPGTTTRAITSQLGLEKTLVGVDVVLNKKLLLRDANESQLLAMLGKCSGTKIIVTPIGGQGYLFGRGNQQISPSVIEKAGRENIIVIATMQKIISLNGRPLLVDTGNSEIDWLLQGYLKITTGHNNSLIYRVSS